MFSARMWQRAALSAALVAATATAGTIYVDDDAPAGGDGSSWANAYQSLAVALDAATADDEVRIAGGIYLAPSGTQFPFVSSFVIRSGVEVRGGYAGLALPGDPNLRDVAIYVTTLSGDRLGDDLLDLGSALLCYSGSGNGYGVGCSSYDVDGDGDVDVDDLGISDNAYHVVSVQNADGTTLLDGVQITAGHAHGDFPSQYERTEGAGLRAVDSDLTVSNCRFVANAATEAYNYGAGAFSTGGAACFSDCTFEQNATLGTNWAVGGGLYVSGPAIVTGCVFVENQTLGDGGGAYVGDGVSFTDCRFEDNRSAGSGGGASQSGNDAQFTNCVFSSNDARNGGGYASSGATAGFRNCIFKYNQAEWYGGGMTSHDSTLTLVNCAFHSNDGGQWPYGNASYASGGSITMTNCILPSNSSYDIRGYSGAPHTLGYCCVPGGYAGEGNIDADPNIVDWATYTLAADSPCINAGDNSAVPADLTTDLNGAARVQQCRVDIGPAESPEPGPYDCNNNSVADACDISGGGSADVNANGVPDECDPDCNANGVPDDVDISNATSPDCNENDQPDECDIADGTSIDCDTNGVPDDCDIAAGTHPDCDANGVPDSCDLTGGTHPDCNENGVPDACDIAAGTSLDCDGNGVPDACDLSAGTHPDCNQNDVPDGCDVAGGASEDCDSDGVPDECQPDCNANGVADVCDISSGTSSDVNGNAVPDDCEPDCNGNGTPDEWEVSEGLSPDCNTNGEPDDCDISSGFSFDCDVNGVPDECDPNDDCDENGVQDICDIAAGTHADVNGNRVPDVCEPDCNGNAIPDDWDIGQGTSADCNGNGVPDECDLADGTSNDLNFNSVPDECEDCNGNGLPDDLDLADGSSADCDRNGRPDECDIDDQPELDLNGNGVIDRCDLPPGTMRLFVKHDATGANTGLDWDDALTDLEVALMWAADLPDVDIQEVWVARGTYRPTQEEPLDMRSFYLGDVALYGGFAGDEDPNTFALSDRDIAANETVLSGDVGELGVAEDNCYHVVRMWGDSVLNGVTVSDGFARISGPVGAGVLIDGKNCVVERCRVEHNRALGGGGGIFVRPYASVVVDASTFVGNQADAADQFVGEGGALAAAPSGVVELRGCLFRGNSAADSGGALWLTASVTLTNCAFSENDAGQYGGAVANSQITHFVNCTFYANTAGWTGGAADVASGSHAYNSIFWANDAQHYAHFDDADLTPEYCCVEGMPQDPATTNFHADPGFVDAGGGDLRLAAGSACIDAGDNDPISNPLDAAGAPRKQDDPATPDTGNGTTPLVDIGAYEYQPDCNGNGVLDWDDIVAGTSQDCNFNKIPDECESAADCNHNGIADLCDIADGTSQDEGGNGVPDECDVDCDGNGHLDDVDIANGWPDVNDNGQIDGCELPEDTAILFVKADATGDNTGVDWENALTDLNVALAFADMLPEVRSIWVAAGVYRPRLMWEMPSERYATFLFESNHSRPLALLGGFAGDEDPHTFDPNDRDLTAHLTVLSGDIGTPGVASDNAHHVVTVFADCGTLDGFHITGGVADRDQSQDERGAGVYVEWAQPPFTLQRCCVHDNQAHYGAGMWADRDDAFEVFRCAFDGNAAMEQGGGVACGTQANPSESHIRFAECSFGANAAAMGGGMYASYRVGLVDCVFERNEADNGGAGLAFGGDQIELVGVSFSDNWVTLDNDGGGLRVNSGDVLVDACDFVGNRARNGAGAHFDGSGALEVQRSLFADNLASNEGGAAYVGHPGRWDGCEFRDNLASRGGGLYLTSDAHQVVVNSIFFANVANEEAGALYKSCSAHLAMTNCTVVSNWAMNSYGALFLSCSDESTMTNTIVWDNVPSDPVDWHFDFDNVNYSCIEGGWQGGVGNLNHAPQFVNGPVGDFRLMPDSPCLDAGDSMAAALLDVLEDFAGEPRFADAGLVPDTGVGPAPVVDIGAHEFADCNANGVRDRDEIDFGLADDCNANGVVDACESTLWDYDGDRTLDMGDLLALLAALGGPGQPIGPPCPVVAEGVFDADLDGDVDLRDYAGFQRAWIEEPEP